MVRRRTLALTVGALGAAWLLATRSGNDAERVDYEVVDRLDGIELRRYPTTVTVETTAPDERTAFGRLFRYISGANRASERVAMTAPVATGETASGDTETDTDEETLGRGGDEIAMTAPVATELGTETSEGGVHMAFFLPDEYTFETAPEPTATTVRLVEHPARTLAVRSFSWWATDRRVDRQRRGLLAPLTAHDIAVVGEPFLMRYDAPWTPPFLRTNEVAVEVQRTKGGR